MADQTVVDLGQKIKAKYPGIYNDLDDAELGRRTKFKYPGSYDDFAEPTEQVVPDESQRVTVPAPENYDYTQEPRLNPHSQPFNPQVIPGILSAVGGTMAGAPGAGLGSVAGIELRNEFPGIFGQPPQSGMGLAANVGGDILKQAVIPSALEKIFTPERLANAGARLMASKIFRNFPAVKEGIAKAMTATGLARYQYPETGIIESAAANASNTAEDLATRISSGDASAIQDSQNTFGGNTIANKLLSLQHDFESGGQVANQESYKKIASIALSDVSHVRNWKLATGEPTTIQQLGINDLVTNGFKEASGKIDAQAILNKLGGDKKQIYEEAISNPKVMDNFKDFLTSLLDQEKTGAMDRVLHYSQSHLIWSAGGALGEMTGHGIVGEIGLGMGGITGGIVLTNKMLGKLMENPQMSQLVVKAMKTKLIDPEASLVSQALAQGVRALGVGASTEANQPNQPNQQ